MVASLTPRPVRVLFLDGVRGWALVLMVLTGHPAGRCWQISLAYYLVEMRRMGRGWQEAERWYREHGPVLGAFGRA